MFIPEKVVPFIERLAKKSAAIITPYFARPNLEVEFKSDETPVTQADRNAERVMRDMIRREFPNHGIIGEEFGEENPGADFIWVLDPIDGTKSFAAGCPLFGTLICLLQEGSPVVGAIHQPVLGQLVIGDNDTTSCNGRKVSMRAVTSLEKCILLTTDIKNIFRYQSGANFQRLADRVDLFRTWGDCYGYLLLATGWADVMIDPIMNPWDLLPLIPVIRGAGGIITTWDGSDPLNGTSIVAANKYLHARVIETLNEP